MAYSKMHHLQEQSNRFLGPGKKASEFPVLRKQHDLKAFFCAMGEKLP